jgi:hypothetical protein
MHKWEQFAGGFMNKWERIAWANAVLLLGGWIAFISIPKSEPEFRHWPAYDKCLAGGGRIW